MSILNDEIALAAVEALEAAGLVVATEDADGSLIVTPAAKLTGSYQCTLRSA
jgi:hypothetical protein